MTEIERLRHLPKLIRETKGRLTVEKPLPGSRRLRCMVNGVEYDPTGLFDKNGRTNFEKLSEDSKKDQKPDRGDIEYVDFIDPP